MTPDLLAALKTERRDIRGQVARHAGRALLIQPEQFEAMTAHELLQHLPYVSREREERMLRDAGVNPLRLVGDFRPRQRDEFVRQLAALSKERS